MLKGSTKRSFYRDNSFETYKIFPPPNNGSKIVGELVPIPSVRSTNNVVNSPYTTIVNGIANDFKNVNITPRNIKNKSHFVANRNYK